MIDVPREDVILMLEAGYLYLAMGKVVEARKVFEGVMALFPKHEVPRVAYANVLFAERKFLHATRVLKEAVKLNPESAFAHSHLGEAFLFYGKKDLALESLKTASNLDKDKGGSGDFARQLMQLIGQGFDPLQLHKKAVEKAKEQIKEFKQEPSS